MIFLSPAVTQLIQTSSTVLDITDMTDISSSKVVFFPLSNLLDGIRGHWSLLMWIRSKENAFLHFDSLKNFNLVYAKKLKDKIVNIFHLKRFKFTSMKTPHQSNYVDCGAYLMAVMNEIAITGKVPVQMLKKINSDYVTNFRAVLSQCILDYNAIRRPWHDYVPLL